MSLDKLYQLVSSLSETVENNEKLATLILSNKLAKCLEKYPQDQTLGLVSRVIKDMSNHNTMFIRRADFKSLYNKFHSHGTKFAELFADELGVKQNEPTEPKIKHDESTAVNLHTGDKVLANALSSVFDKKLPVKNYSQFTADKAVKSVKSTLESWNLKPSKLTIGDGNDHFIVVKADYDTPKGLTSFYVPVEVYKDEVLQPEMFMGNTGPEDLKHTTLKSYITQQAGNKNKVSASDILTVLVRATTPSPEISDAELALAKYNSSQQGTSDFFAGQIVGQKMATASIEDVVLPVSEETFTFEKQFNTSNGLASWKFGKDIVNTARQHLVRELASFGFNRPQIVVTNFDDSTIFYGISLDTGKVAFTVPVSVVNNQIQKPKLMLCNGSLETFTRDGINKLVSENKTDTKIAAVASNFAVLKPSEILDNLRQALADENYAKAEDALNVLANYGDDKVYALAFQVYMNGLAGEKTAETKCSNMVKSAVSEYPICAHTGLPINKVYQDNNGYCHPLYRKGMDETYQGASFMNSKIFG